MPVGSPTTIPKKPDCVLKVFGFGSFFRKSDFDDVDLLIIVPPSKGSELASNVEVILRWMQDLEKFTGLNLHPLMLTSDEISDAPLRDMHELVPLFPRELLSPTVHEIRDEGLALVHFLNAD